MKSLKRATVGEIYCDGEKSVIYAAKLVNYAFHKLSGHLEGKSKYCLVTNEKPPAAQKTAADQSRNISPSLAQSIGEFGK